MRRFLREPLLHFVLLGGALFALHAMRSEPGERANRIVIGAAQVEHLAAGFARTWMRPPRPEELDGLIQEYVREEVASREALELGLDRDDTIVRRRLRQKLEFVTESLAALVEPTDAELQAFVGDHPEKFRLEARTSFEQLFVSTERRGSAAEADARALLAELASGGGGASDELGDPTLLPGVLELASASEIDRLFGDGFARALEATEPGRWAGPFPSAYGLHLVLVREREPGRLPALAEARDAVRSEWLAAKRGQALEEFYASLLERYEVVLESPPPAGDPTPTPAGSSAPGGAR